MPQVKCSVIQDYPTPPHPVHFWGQLKAQIVTWTPDWLARNQDITTPSLGSINFLELFLQNSEKHCTYYTISLLQKDITQEQQMEEMHRAGHGGKCGASMPSPGVLLSKHFDVVTNPEALQIHHLKSFYTGIIMSGEFVISSALSHHRKIWSDGWIGNTAQF